MDATAATSTTTITTATNINQNDVSSFLKYL